MCTLPHENSLSVNEVMNTFLTRSVRIQVQSNQNKSRDSLPCLCWLMLISRAVLIVCVNCQILRFVY